MYYYLAIQYPIGSMVYIPTFNMANVGKYTRLGPYGYLLPSLVKGFFMAHGQSHSVIGSIPTDLKSCTSENYPLEN